MSKHIHSLKEGDELECKGPIMKLEYKPNMKKKIGMVHHESFVTLQGACGKQRRRLDDACAPERPSPEYQQIL